MIFTLTKFEEVKTADEARNLAIAWQHWFGKTDICYQELSTYQDYFYKLAEKFNLIEEFNENGII